ncbi:hypothetical protein [Neobacillus jeddahensis]|uniref:hypothetical protein n=1 Tax=Neobacillus jeddahensis TaxID=1461580 RepID=UPI0037098D22
MLKLTKKWSMVLFFVLGIVFLNGCGLLFSNELIVNRYADALLTKNNELQFRFRINNEILEAHQLYKVKVTIHDDKLAAAVGKREIVYGEDQVRDGDYLEVKGKSEKYIFMDPLPLQKDLHIQELKNMIERDQAVSIEVFNDEEVFGRTYLTNFSSEL